jgi:NTP pyrophosphatase (non-canonical NTP hydrolase)
MRLGEYQIKAHNTATVDDVDVYSLGLIGEAGSVASAIKKFKRDAPAVQQLKRAIAEELGDTLWYLAEIATRFDLKLEDIAAENIAKTEFLFNFGNLNDSDFPSDQRFPRELDIRFDDDGTRLQLFRGNEPIGAPLTDNAYDDDGYRYHDAVHLAYMTVLGWSPVMRSLLKCKRKSKRKVDEVEDGARARALVASLDVV